jgi:hypothetical protein
MFTQDALSLPLPDLPGVGQGWELLLPAAERARRCTGSSAVQCEERRDAIIAACVHLGTRRVAEAFGVSREVVRALRAEAVRTGKLDQLKEETGRRALAASDRVLDRIEDEVDQLPRASLALTYAILQDKGLLLTGQPTARIEHTVTVTHDDINAWVESLPTATPVSSGGADLQKGMSGGSTEPVAGELVESGSGQAGDIQSPALCQSPSDGLLIRADVGQNDPKKGAE